MKRHRRGGFVHVRDGEREVRRCIGRRTDGCIVDIDCHAVRRLRHEVEDRPRLEAQFGPHDLEECGIVPVRESEFVPSASSVTTMSASLTALAVLVFSGSVAVVFCSATAVGTSFTSVTVIVNVCSNESPP